MTEINQIIAIVSRETGIPVNQMLSRSRKANIVQARQISMWLCRWNTRVSQQKIAYAHGCDRHATVIWACNQIEDFRSVNRAFREYTDNLKSLI